MLEFYTHAKNFKNHTRCVSIIDCTAAYGTAADIIYDNDKDIDEY